MGYGYYELPDGRKAGYGVEAICDQQNCETKIDRGLGYLCGQNPDGWRDADEPGCGNYYCEAHRYGNHECTDPACEMYAADGNSCCGLRKGHDLPHRDDNDGTTFTRTKADWELAGKSPVVIDLGEDSEQWLVTATSDGHSAEEAVRKHWETTYEEHHIAQMLEDYPLGALGLEHRTDWAWKHPEGWPPEREPEDDSRLVCGKEGEGLPRFAGYLVQL